MRTSALANSVKLCIVVIYILDILEFHHGWGQHLYYLVQDPHSHARIIEAMHFTYINQMLLIISSMFIKASIGAFLLRVFGTKKAWRWIIYSLIIFVVITTIISAAMTLAQCRPVSKLWNHDLPGSCWSPMTIVNVSYFNGGKLLAAESLC